MSFSRNINGVKIFDAVSLGTSVNSAWIEVQFLTKIGISLVATGTPTGTITVEGSNDAAHSDNQAVTTSPTPLSLAGAATTISGNITDFAFRYIRVVYTRSSSTGTINGWLTAKEG